MESSNRGAERSASRHPSKDQAHHNFSAVATGEKENDRTRHQAEGGFGWKEGVPLASVGRGVADEPGVEPHAVGSAEPDVLVDEPEAGRRDGVRARQAREHGHVDEALLESHQRREAHHRHASPAVGQRLQPSRHISTRCRRRDARRGDGRGLRLWCRARRRGERSEVGRARGASSGSWATDSGCRVLHRSEPRLGSSLSDMTVAIANSND
jgi:hypothetical protein